MQNAVPSDQGAMLAVLGMTIEEVEKELNFLLKLLMMNQLNLYLKSYL